MPWRLDHQKNPFVISLMTVEKEGEKGIRELGESEEGKRSKEYIRYETTVTSQHGT